MKNLIVANWKMNPVAKKEAEDLFDAIKKGVENATAEVVICPPSIYLPLLKGLTLGAQNCFWEEKGAFTGEISVKMLKDSGVEYVIIGHSERRTFFGETDELLNKKIKAALKAGLKIIFCIGETVEENIDAKRNEILENQIKTGLDGINDTDNINIAYEPVWAIGTGNNCSFREAKEAIDFIRKLVKPHMRILYGGSVKSDNSSYYIKDAGADGLLVGGSSLKAEEFVKIVKSAE